MHGPRPAAPSGKAARSVRCNLNAGKTLRIERGADRKIERLSQKGQACGFVQRDIIIWRWRS
jgi:hypothetical protein